MIKRALLSVLLLVMLAACQTAPTPVLSPPELPDAWLNHTMGTDMEALPTAWWEGFDDDQLTAFVQAAQVHNTDLLSAFFRVEQARAQVDLAQAPRFPLLSAGASGSTSRPQASADSSRQFSASASVSYELDLWGRLRQGREAAAALLAANEFARDGVLLSLQASVVSAYLQNQYLADHLALAHENLALAQEIQRIVSVKVRYGAVSPLDLAQQNTVVANQRARLPLLLQRQQASRTALAVLLGDVPQGFAVRSTGLEAVRLPALPASLPAEVIALRPDVGQALAEIHAADARMSIARAAYFPAVTLTGSHGYRSASLSSLLSADPVSTLSMAISQAVFDGGARAAQRAIAEAQWQAQTTEYVGVVLRALQDVEDALGQAAAVDEQLLFRSDALREAERAFALAEVRYREGRIEFIELLSAQAALNNARQAHLDIRFEQLQSRVDVFRALGVGARPLEVSARPDRVPE